MQRMQKVTIMLLGTLLLPSQESQASAKAKPVFPQTPVVVVASPSPKPQTKPSPQAKITAEQVIQAADEALKKKDLAIAQTEAARSEAQKDLTDSQKQVLAKDKQLNSIGKNGFVMLGSGIAGGALIAANVVAPGIGIIVAAALIAIFKL